MDRKVLVIGLDGGSWSIFDRFIEAGVMPNLERLCREGYRANLISTIPAITPTAWTSFATGMNPGKHGIYGFTAPHAMPGSYVPPTARRDLIREQSLWRRLSGMGLESIVLCVPMTYPAEPIKGSLVTGMLTPGLNSECTYPASLKQELLVNNCMPGFALNVVQGQTGREGQQMQKSLENDAAEFFVDLNNITDGLYKTVQYMMDKPWQFFMAVFIGTDRVQHSLYDKVVSIGPTGGSLLAQRIRSFYSKMDNIIGEIVKTAGKETVCVLMSDHGFGPCAGRFYLSRWLIEAGYARFKSHRLRNFAKKTLEITGTKRFVARSLSGKAVARIASDSYPLDWSKSKAFFVSGDGIRINLKGREREGIVEPGSEYEQLRNELREQLLLLEYPLGGKRVLSNVCFPEQLYHGNFLQWAPDLIVEPNDEQCYTFTKGKLENSKLMEPLAHYPGNHRPEGIFLVHGPGVKPNAKTTSAQIVDVAPTIMWQLGLPVPEDMDGDPVTEAFACSPAKRFCEEVATEKATAEPGQSESEAGRYSKEEEDMLRQRLKNLGYID